MLEIGGKNCKIGVAQWCLNTQGSEAIQEAKMLGFDYMQIATYSPGGKHYLGNTSVVDSYLSKSKEFKLILCGIAINIIGKIGILDSFGIYGQSQLAIILRDAVRAATILDIPFLYVPSFGKSEIKNDEDLLFTANLLKGICLFANEHNITVASENTLNFKDTAKLINLVNESNFKILIDMYNPLLWGNDVCKILSYNQTYIADQIHVKDGINGVMGNERLGEGDTPLNEILREIVSKGREYIYIFENDYHNDASSFVKQDIFAFQNYLNLSLNQFHLQKENYCG
jgi:sugar phosphate isomerase/epimerase